MCGIVTIMDIKGRTSDLREQALRLAKRLRHRGPDWSGIWANDQAILAHERLAIVDVEHGAQPLLDRKTGCVLAVNGEIYNHKDLQKTLKKEHDFQTNSDCEVILYLYDEFGPAFLDKLNGIFAFVLYDPNRQTFLIARDHIGIVPLYYGRDREGNLYVASELKALHDVCVTIDDFPPGHYCQGNEEAMVRYYKPEWEDTRHIPEKKLNQDEFRERLEAAVKRQLMCDVPYGLLISGGVDSSIIAAIAAKFSAKRIETEDVEQAWWPRMHSFSVGLPDSPDLIMAKEVARHIGSVHHAVFYTIQEGLDALSDVIYQIETFDVTTIRASTPMYLMARKIRSMGIKMILSGEGADEIFGGYLYFHKAPNALEFHQELVRKLQNLYKYDCLRANKSMASWGVEARVPFLDKDFLDYAMSIDTNEKMITKGRIEKDMLRRSFGGYIPEKVLWRQKEQFSDGVGYGWIDSLKALAESQVSDDQLLNARYRFKKQTPLTKEAYYYRVLFEKHYSNPAAIDCVKTERSVACSTETALRWEKSFSEMVDPSGRAVRTIHQQSY